MTKQERISIFIDGSNTYFKLRSFDVGLTDLVHFDYRGLGTWLTHGRFIVDCRYYVGVVRAEEGNVKAQALRQEQQRLFAHLLSPSQNFVIQKGYLIKSGGKYHEKGVDVELAVDLLVGAYENLYDTAILISSDSDLVPAVKKVKLLGKTVEHIGFASHPAFALQRHATISRFLIKEEVEPFVAKKEKALDGDETP
ncbi:MAG: NYN domain-containing protein [Patescibacteria group bacterium]